jgi:subtilisin family serine protease
MSLGISSVYTPLNEAVDRAVAAGVVVAVAAGNSGRDACRSSPASAGSAITVGATDITDRRASWSNFGKCVDIFAPGVSITSCSLTQPEGVPYSGTSMASPHVAGVAALLLEEDPCLTPAALAQKMIDDATPNVVINEGRRSPNLLLYTGLILADDPAVNPIPCPAPGPGPDPGPTPSCDRYPPSASCNVNGDCCSDWCKGGGSNTFCA